MIFNAKHFVNLKSISGTQNYTLSKYNKSNQEL